MTRLKKTALALLASVSMSAIGAGNAQELDIAVSDEIVVRGARIPDEKRATSEISAVLDEASFQRTGDSDIGAALARVTGLSLSQGKFIIVRGLNERYSNVTVNGSPLPSPEPLQRVAPLDIIPTSILSGSLVQKTYSPEYSAEFGGGLIDLRTTAVPDEFFLEIGGSLGLDSVTSFKEGFSYDGGERDWLGFDDGTRNAGLIASTFGDGNFGSQTRQDLIDTSLEHNKTLLITENEIPPNYSFSIAGGDAFDLSDTIRIGGTLAVGIGNDWQTREGRREQGLVSTGVFGNVGQVYDFVSTTSNVETNGISTIGVEVGENHEFTFTNFMLRSTLKEARLSDGLGGDCDCAFLRTNTEFFERQVWQTQARGDHVFPGLGDLTAEWRIAYGEAFRDSPYQRLNTYVENENGVLGYDFQRVADTLSNTVSFSKIEDENIDAGIDLQLPFTLLGNEHTLKGGWAYKENDRDTLNRAYRYETPQGSIPELEQSRIDLIYSDAVLGTNLIDLRLIGGDFFHDNTKSDLQVNAFYGGLDLQFGPYVRIAAGARYEDGSESTESFATTFPGSFTKTRIDEDYWLPAATVTWNPIGDLQVRAGFSQTITRPQFRELAPAFFVDEDTDLLLLGNPFLVNSEIDNYDARIEYYFSRGQFITIGGFYKDITNPIEDTFVLREGGLVISSFINTPAAKLYGLEFEFEKNFYLADMMDWAAVASKDLILKANYTWSQSEVSADGAVTVGTVDNLTRRFAPNPLPASNFVTDGRPLQGQSNHIFNLQFGVEDQELDSRATFLVTYNSKRIRNVESFRSGVTAPAVIERPPFRLDFVYSRGFEKWGGQWEIGLAVRNILGDDYDARQDFADGTTAVFDFYELGREFSMSLKRKF